MNVKFLVQCLVRMDYAGLFQTVSKVHKACGKNRLSILTDVVKCGLRYGAGYNDYLLCEFYNLTEEQRATYITRQVNNKLVALLNDRALLPPVRQQKRLLHHLLRLYGPGLAGLHQGHKGGPGPLPPG